MQLYIPGILHCGKISLTRDEPHNRSEEAVLREDVQWFRQLFYIIEGRELKVAMVISQGQKLSMNFAQTFQWYSGHFGLNFHYVTVKVCFYIAQYPVHCTAQSALHTYFSVTTHPRYPEPFMQILN